MAIIHINVQYHGEDIPLTLDHPDITLQHGDQVEWKFHHVPSHCLAFIFFPQERTNALRQAFGPFQYLEPSFSTVLGIGNSGHHSDYPYMAMVLGQERALATSGLAVVRNPAAAEDTSPDVLVRYEGENRFLVEPLHLTLETGRTAIWYIERIPLDHFVTFHFGNFPESPMQGPFQSFSLSRGFGDSWLANGAGFLTDQLAQHPHMPLSPIQYHVRLRDAFGRVVASHDPVIEPLESPPGGGG